MLRLQNLLIVALMVCSTAYAQTHKKYGSIKGKLVNAATKAVFNDLTVSIPSIKAFTISAEEGNFVINELPYGTYDLSISGEYAVSQTVHVTVNKSEVDAGTIEVTQSATKNEPESQIPTIAVEDLDAISNDENNDGQSLQGYFTPAQDQFLFNATRTFGIYRFRPRGTSQGEQQLNGFNILDIARGFSSFSQFGGLNEVLRSRSVNYGIKPSDFTFGVINGSNNYIDATAASQRKGSTITYGSSNRSYRNRISLTHNSGLLKNGWAYSLSASKRWAEESYYKGTSYDGYSFYGSASKTLGKGVLSLTTIGSSIYRALAATTVQEAYDLTGDHYYNPSWGKYKGDERSGRTSQVFQPMAIANYTYKPSDRTRWNTSIGYQMGANKRGSIDYYNGYNPYPDYYHNLPSYYINGVATPNPGVAADVAAQYRANPDLMQIQWDNLYQENFTNIRTIQNANGGTTPVTGKQSIYIFSNDVDNMNKLSFNSTIEHAVNGNLNVQGGINVTRQSDEYYKEVADLLGGDFYVNYNQFAAQASPGNPNVIQNNLNIPNQIVRKGDKYGYDYILNIMKSAAWGQAVYNYNKFNFFAALEVGNTTFSRDGKTKSGIFPDDSYGKSADHSFFTYSAKGGVRYQPDAKNILFANAGFGQYAPNEHNTFISEKTRNAIVNNPEVALFKSFEAGYQYKSTRFIATFTGYVSDVTNGTQIKRFFNDDPDIQSYVNYVMQEVAIRSIGTELSLSYKINSLFTLNANASVNQSFYTDRPVVSIYQDNNPAATIGSRTVYIKDYYVGSGPQSIYTGGLTYHPTNTSRLGINVNYMDRNFVDINPERRTTLAVDGVERGSKTWNAIVGQEELPSAFTVDLNGGKTWNISKYTKGFLHNGSSLILNVGVSNVLNNTDIKLVGYEQLRFDYKYGNPDKFPNKYTYAMGINFNASLSLRF